MRNLILLAAAVAAIAVRPALADPKAPVAVELFTSQGCYSCPPAEVYLGELANRSDVVAIEWHVDYWDDLIYGSAGQWKDPFSSPAATSRQKAYNAAIEGRARAYTPQMIVGGRRGMVGVYRDQVERAIRRIRKGEGEVALTVGSNASGMITVDAKGAAATLWRVDFIRRHVTEVLRGENKGKTLENHHIAVGKSRIGETGSGPVVTSRPGRENGCAIFAQIGETGPVLAAAYCPMSGPPA